MTEPTHPTLNKSKPAWHGLFLEPDWPADEDDEPTQTFTAVKVEAAGS
ncbi:hypothetical protein [Streptomyces sp. NPDC060243]